MNLKTARFGIWDFLKDLKIPNHASSLYYYVHSVPEKASA